MNLDNLISYFIYRNLSEEPFQGAKTICKMSRLKEGYFF